MTPLALALAARIGRPPPARFSALGRLSVPFLSDRGGGARRRGDYLKIDVYTTSCLTEVLLPRHDPAATPIVLNDLRLCEVALDLIQAARQGSDRAQRALSVGMVSRLALEFSLPYKVSALQAGLLLRHLEADAAEEMLRRRHPGEFACLGEAETLQHLETVSQFTVSHEATHHWLSVDSEFRRAAEVDAAGRLSRLAALSAGPSGADAAASEPLLEAIAGFARRAGDHREEGEALPDEVEEAICDLSALSALVDAVAALGVLDRSLGDLVSSLWAAMAAVWLVVMVRRAVTGLLEHGAADLSGMPELLAARAGSLLLLMGDPVSRALGLQEEDARRLMKGVWQAQPDYERIILDAVEILFSNDALESALVLGARALDSDVCSAGSVEGAILRRFGWR